MTDIQSATTRELVAELGTRLNPAWWRRTIGDLVTMRVEAWVIDRQNARRA